MSAPPRPGRLLRRPAYHFDLTGTWAADPPFDARDVPVAARDLQLPLGGLPEPFLWHAGSARALGGFDAVPTEDAAFQHGGYVYGYYPAPSRWGRRGSLLRRPRSVWLNWDAGGLDAPTVYAAAEQALTRHNVSLVLALTTTGRAVSPLVDWAPEPLLTASNFPNPDTYTTLVDPRTWLAGDLLVLAVSQSRYLGNVVVAASGSPSFPASAGWEEHAAGGGGYSVYVGRTQIAGARAAYPALAARVGRLRGTLLYDPSPPDPGAPEPTWADVEAAYDPDALWDDITGGFGWTRTAVAGLAGGTPDSAALGAAVAAAVTGFFA